MQEEGLPPLKRRGSGTEWRTSAQAKAEDWGGFRARQRMYRLREADSCDAVAPVQGRPWPRLLREEQARRMIQFADFCPDEEIVVTLSRHLSWSHSKLCFHSADGCRILLCRLLPHDGMERPDPDPGPRQIRQALQDRAKISNEHSIPFSRAILQAQRSEERPGVELAG